MELWKWIIVILIVLLLSYLAYIYFRKRPEEGFADTTANPPKEIGSLPNLSVNLPNSGNAVDVNGNPLSSGNLQSCPSGATASVGPTLTAQTRTYMYIFDPTAVWVQANIALLEYPVVKNEVYASIKNSCQSASGTR